MYFLRGWHKHSGTPSLGDGGSVPLSGHPIALCRAWQEYKVKRRRQTHA